MRPCSSSETGQGGRQTLDSLIWFSAALITSRSDIVTFDSICTKRCDCHSASTASDNLSTCYRGFLREEPRRFISPPDGTKTLLLIMINLHLIIVYWISDSVLNIEAFLMFWSALKDVNSVLWLGSLAQHFAVWFTKDRRTEKCYIRGSKATI